MALSIVENYIDLAGFRRVRIQNTAGDSLLLKFPQGLTNQQMLTRAQLAVDAEIARRQAAAAEVTRLRSISVSVGQFLNGQLNAAQQTTLLTSLAREWKG